MGSSLELRLGGCLCSVWTAAVREDGSAGPSRHSQDCLTWGHFKWAPPGSLRAPPLAQPSLYLRSSRWMLGCGESRLEVTQGTTSCSLLSSSWPASQPFIHTSPFIRCSLPPLLYLSIHPLLQPPIHPFTNPSTPLPSLHPPTHPSIPPSLTHLLNTEVTPHKCTSLQWNTRIWSRVQTSCMT